MEPVFKWYAVYTRPRWEKKVAALLNEKNVQHYCPLIKVQRQWADRKKTVLEPLFKSYVFIRIADVRQFKVWQMDGILHLVKYLGYPAVIRDLEIAAIEQFLNDCSSVRVEKLSVSCNDTVQICSGPLRLQKGKVLNIRHKTIRIYLPALGVTLTGNIEKLDLEKTFDEIT